MPAGRIEPSFVAHEEEVDRPEEKRCKQKASRRDEWNESFVFAQECLKTQIVGPQEHKSKDSTQHANTGNKGKGAIWFKELSVDRRLEYHEADESMDEYQQESGHP